MTPFSDHCVIYIFWCFERFVFLCFTQFDGRSNRLSNKFNDMAPLSVEKKVLHPEIWLEDQWSSSWTNFVKEVST